MRHRDPDAASWRDRRPLVSALVTLVLVAAAITIVLLAVPKVIDAFKGGNPWWALLAVACTAGSLAGFCLAFYGAYRGRGDLQGRDYAEAALTQKGAATFVPGGQAGAAALTSVVLRRTGMGAAELADRAVALLVLVHAPYFVGIVDRRAAGRHRSRAGRRAGRLHLVGHRGGRRHRARGGGDRAAGALHAGRGEGQGRVAPRAGRGPGALGRGRGQERHRPHALADRRGRHAGLRGPRLRDPARVHGGLRAEPRRRGRGHGLADGPDRLAHPRPRRRGDGGRRPDRHLVAFGASASAMAAPVLAYRVITLALPAAAGGVAYLLLRRRLGRDPDAARTEAPAPAPSA